MTTYLNNKDKNNDDNSRHHVVAGAGTIFTLAIIMVVSSMAITPPVAATTTPTTTSNTTATTPSSSSSGIELSSQPVYQDHIIVVGQNPINETHMSLTFSGNGILTLPNATQTINTTSNGTALVSFTTLSVQGKENIRTQGGNETATATIYEIDREPAATTGETKGIVIAVFQTNSTGMLAPLNGMILAGTDDIQTTTGESSLTLWQWESGISNSGVSTSASTNTTTPGTQGAPSTNSSNTTATSTNEASSSS
jgi:hypothetical protein